MKDLIVIGGGCAGLTAALYAARSGKSVLLFEAENIGGQITAAPFVDNYPAAPHISGMEFADKLFGQVLELGVEVEAERVVGLEKEGQAHIAITEYGRYAARNLILATGAKHRKLGLPNEERLTGQGVSYCAVCDGAFYKGRAVAVVGGGNTAFCDALFLSNLCSQVYLIHRRASFRADAAMVKRLDAVSNVTYIMDSALDALIGETTLTGIHIKSVLDGRISNLSVDALFVAIGHEPDSAPFAHYVRTDDAGYFIAGEDCATNIPGIYVAGDCRTKSVRQLTTAIADGANAAVGAWACSI